MSDISNNSASSEQKPLEPRKRLTVVLSLVALISLVAWVLSGGSGADNTAATIDTNTQSSSAPAPGTVSLTAIPATIVTKAELISATKDLGFVIYWNGKMKDTNIELTVLTEGKVYVRYLPKDVAAGATEPYLTIATYYDPEALGKVQNLGATAGAKYINYSGGAVAASTSESDSNIYFAFDTNPALYNIFAPDPQIGWAALDSGTISILQ
jgi:hypothetical protein